MRSEQPFFIVEIEGAHPLPPQKRGRRRRNLTNALLALKVGQSILVDEFKQGSNYWSYAAKISGYRFTQRKVREGTRIWRVS